MSKQSFSSFSEFLSKKDLPQDEQRPVEYDVLVKVFRFLDLRHVEENLRHFAKEDLDAILGVYELEAIQKKGEGYSNGELESLISSQLAKLSNETKNKISDILGKKAVQAEREQKKVATLAQKYTPKDEGELLEDLQNRIKELKETIIDIEMHLMTLENDGLENSDTYKKSANARERRKQILQQLERRIKGLQKKSKKA